eukprot:810699-Rhodomonas_salina.1
MSSSLESKSVCSTLIVSCTSVVNGGTCIVVEHDGISRDEDGDVHTLCNVVRGPVLISTLLCEGHETQFAVSGDDALEYCPNAHIEHTTAPASSAKDPAGHATHAPDPAES